MRVSLINSGLRSQDAIGQRILNQVRYFQRRGDDVHVYVLSPPVDVPPDVEALTSVVTLGQVLEGKQEDFFYSDLYIYHYPGHYLLMETIRGIERGTVIFYYHNVTPPELWGTDAGRERLVDGLEGSALAHYADLCITPSPFNKQDLVDRLGYAPERIYVLPPPVDLGQFSPGDPDPELVRRYALQGQRVLLFVGRMAGNKRVDLLIETLARIKEQVPDTKLLLVGDAQDDPAFHPIVSAARERAAELGVSGDVVWTGRVDQVAPFYRLADVYVTASLHEGFGVPLIEAMASGVPVVASRAGAMPWVVENAGLQCEPRDVADLADKVVSVLQSADLRQELVKRGLERAEQFSLESWEAGLSRILDDALAETPTGAGSQPGPRTPGPRDRPAREGALSSLLLESLADVTQARADVAMREYVVRSGVPLVGPLIAWLRRNLTSHLREPYLDPIVERQVAFNQRVAEWIGRATGMLVTRDRRRQELEARVEALEAHVAHLVQRMKEDEP